MDIANWTTYNSGVKRNQIFPIFDPKSWQVLGYKERSKVHKDGDWHMGVQAYILRENRGITEVLIQKRSQYVDLAGGKFDQSLAVQMIQDDNLNPLLCLERGLKNELDLNLKNMRHIQILQGILLNIVKTYSHTPNILNREQTKLYLIKYENEKMLIDSKKIDDLIWTPWNKMFSWKRTDPGLFTKTSRFYAVDPIISSEIERSVDAFMSESSLPKNTNLPKKVVYYSENHTKHDVSIHSWNQHKRKIYLLNREGFSIDQTIEVE